MNCIYKIMNPKGKIYIGQSRNWIKRLSNYRRISCKGQFKIYNSLKKYGFENHKFEILVEFNDKISQESLNFYEIYWWKFFKDSGFEMLNLKEPGSRGQLSQESKNKIKKKLTGKKLSLETARKISISNKGKIHSPETIQKIKESWIRGRNSRTILKGKDVHNSRMVVNLQNGIYYDTIREAENSLNINRNVLTNKLNGRTKNNTYFIYV